MEFIRTHQGHREAGGLVWGVEPICSVLSEHGLPIAPSTYYEHRGRAQTRREVRDEELTARSGGAMIRTCGWLSAGNVKLIWPQEDGLMWPHLV